MNKKYENSDGIEGLISNNLKLSKRMIYVFAIVGFVAVTPYGLKGVDYGVQSFKAYNLENKQKKAEELASLELNKSKELLQASEDKYRAYIDGDTEKFLTLLKTSTLNTLNLTIYQNPKDKDIVCHFVDKSLGKDFIMAYHPDNPTDNPFISFENTGKLSYSVFDFSNKVTLNIEEFPTGYQLDLVNSVREYVYGVADDNVSIDYNLLSSDNDSKIVCSDDYLKSVYIAGKEKYIPLLKSDISIFKQLKKYEVNNELSKVNVKVSVLSHNSNIINYIEVKNGDVLNTYVVAYNEKSPNDNRISLAKMGDSDKFSLTDMISKTRIEIDMTNGGIYFKNE